MTEKKKKKRRGTVLIVLGAAALAAACLLAAWNLAEDRRAGEAASAAVETLEQTIESRRGGEAAEPTVPAGTESAAEMPTVEIDGQLYIGIIEVPDVNVKLPVMAEYSETNLTMSPCCYSGSYLTDDFVILGHSYISHFRPLRQADVGDTVYFTNVDGQVYRYVISNLETLRPTEVSRMIENDQNSADQNANWDMTLFTCTADTMARFTVRCIRDGE